MSYLIWFLIRGRKQYPTGLAWILLSVLRVFDWFAFIGLSVFFIVNLAGFAIDARSYVHYKTMVNSYDIELASLDSQGEDKTFENFRRVEKQRAIYKWFGKALVVEEELWDQWRSLFDYNGESVDNVALIPFFWRGGHDHAVNSTAFLDGYYSLMGLDLRGADGSTSYSYYYLPYVYGSMKTYTENALNQTPHESGLFDKFVRCGDPLNSALEYAAVNINPSYQNLSEMIAKKEEFEFYKQKNSAASQCLLSVQHELGVKQYPTDEMLAYNSMVVDYHIDSHERAIANAKQEKAEQGGAFVGGKVYPHSSKAWHKEMYLRYTTDCDINCDDTLITNDDWANTGFVRSLADLPFYDIVVNNNEQYKD